MFEEGHMADVNTVSAADDASDTTSDAGSQDFDQVLEEAMGKAALNFAMNQFGVDQEFEQEGAEYVEEAINGS